MNALTLLYVYLAGAALMAARTGWYIRYRLDKYDWMFSDVWMSFWLGVILWPLFVLKPTCLLRPVVTASWNVGQAEEQRELDRLALDLPPCGPAIRYAPKYDDCGECHSAFIFSAAEVEAIMAKRLAELPAEQHGRFADILNWLRQRDDSIAAPTDVPAAWNGHFLKVAIGMMKRGLGIVTCGKCGEAIPHEQITLETTPAGMLKTSGWVYELWMCPQRHKLLTKDFMHFYIRRTTTDGDDRKPRRRDFYDWLRDQCL